jgi:hypothetical protein
MSLPRTSSGKVRRHACREGSREDLEVVAQSVVDFREATARRSGGLWGDSEPDR